MAFWSAKISGLSVTALASVSERFGGVADLVKTCAHHLRLAAEGVWVLDLLAVFVRVADFADPPS